MYSHIKISLVCCVLIIIFLVIFLPLYFCNSNHISTTQIENKQIYIKKYRFRKNGTTCSERYKLEKECLMKLSANNVCMCENKINHFPEIVKYDDKNKKLFISDCGEKIKDKTILCNYKDDLICIRNCLVTNKIYHLDLHEKNIYIKENRIYLIDFDISVHINPIKKNNCVISERYKKLSDSYKNNYRYYFDSHTNKYFDVNLEIK